MKNNVVKGLMALSVAVLFAVGTLNAQDRQERNVSYNFINEYGFFVGKHVGWSGVFINGVALRQNDVLGVGVGYGLNTASFQEVPVFFNYRHYFDRGRKLKPCLNVAAGVGFHIWERQCYDVDYRPYEGDKTFGAGLYATLAGGFRVKALSFTGGFFFRTFPATKEFAGGIEAKVGYTF